MPAALGPDAFWQVYRQLDERSTLRPDFRAILLDVARGPSGFRRGCRMIADKWLRRGQK